MEEQPLHRQAMLMTLQGKTIDAIAEHFGVNTDAVHAWLAVANVESQIAIEAARLARAAAFPSGPAPLSTAARMRQVVAEAIEPPLAQRGYLRAGSVWYRSLAELWHLVDLQIGKHPSRTFRDFTLNFGLYFAGDDATRSIPPGAAVREPPETYQAVVHGRIGTFSSIDADIWWAVDRVWIGRYFPPAPIGEAAAVDEITNLLSVMLDFLDSHRSVRTVVELAHRLGRDRATSAKFHANAAALENAEAWLTQQGLS